MGRFSGSGLLCYSGGVEEEEQPGLRGAGFWVLGAVPLIYLLALGPVVRFYDRMGGTAQKAFEAIYLPLELLVQTFPAARDLVRAYLSLWM